MALATAEATGANTVDTLNGNFKKVYAPNLSKIIPSSVKILPEIKFVARVFLPIPIVICIIVVIRTISTNY